MDNSGYLSEADKQAQQEDHDNLPNTFTQQELRKIWSTPVGFAVAATTSDFLEETLEARLEHDFFIENEAIKINSSYGVMKECEEDKILCGRPTCEGVHLTCTCTNNLMCTCPKDSNQNANSGHKHAKHMFKEEHAKKFMCTLKLFSAEKQVEFDSAEDELNHVQTCLSQSMNESVYKVNSVADALIAKINMEREELIRRITEDGSLAITNIEAQRQFVDDLKRSLQHADDETTDVLGRHFDNGVVRKASNLTDKVRKIQVTEPTEQCLRPTVIDFEKSSNLEKVSIGRLIERPIAAGFAQEFQDEHDELHDKQQGQGASPKRRPLLKFGNGFGRPSSVVIAYDVSVNRSGESVAVAAGAGGVLVFSTSDGAFLFRFCGPEDERVLDAKNVAHLSNGNILVIDGRATGVRVFEPFGRFLHKFVTRKPSKEVKEPRVRLCSIIVDKDDNILVGDRRRLVITMHEAGGSKIQTLPTGIEPDYLAVSSKEIIAVSGSEAFEVQLMNYIGQFLLRISSFQKSRSLWPKGVCFDEHSKYLYVAHYKSLGEKSIHRYSIMTGRYIDCIVKSLSGPNGIACFADNKLAVADFGCVKIFSLGK